MAEPATRRETIVIGAVAAAAGLYFMLVGAGILPVPGGPRNLHAPLWVAFCAGAAFFLGGVAVVAQSYGGADQNGNLPADAPLWLKYAVHLNVVAIFACFALIASWIAFGEGPRRFTGSFGGTRGPVDAGVGRVVFGIAAVILWACTIGIARAGLRKLRLPAASIRPDGRSPRP